MKKMKKVNFKILGIALMSTLILAGCRRDNNKTQPEPKPQPIVLSDSYDINTVGLYPEGIDFDNKNNVFVVSSFNKGAVYTLSADGKKFTELIKDPKLIAALGVYTDEANNRYIVVSGDAGISEKSAPNKAGAGQVAYVGFYDATNGSLIKSVDLKGLTPNAAAFPNDIAMDKAGNVYITDSFSPVIYKISNDYTASIFTTNAALFTPTDKDFGLNGIVYHPDGYLIVSKTDSNQLFKVLINNPQTATQIGGLTDKIRVPDGLELTNDNKLVVIENGFSYGRAYTLSTTDAWNTATIFREETIGKAEFPTTAALASNNEIYVLQSRLAMLLNNDKTRAEYTIKKLNPKANN